MCCEQEPQSVLAKIVSLLFNMNIRHQLDLSLCLGLAIINIHWVLCPNKTKFLLPQTTRSHIYQDCWNLERSLVGSSTYQVRSLGQ